MFQSDLEDAYSVVLVIAGVEDDAGSYGLKVRSNWEKAVKQGEITIWDQEQLEMVRISNRGRRVQDRFMINTIIIGRTKSGAFIALDGSHRIGQHIKNGNINVPIFIVDITWLDDADDMEFG